MAKQEVGLKIDVDVKSVGNMKQELRAATQELIAVNEKFGSTSKQAMDAAKRVANLKDAIGDAKSLVDAFNPDARFKAFGQTLGAVAGGFSAVQGAMGLLGSESEDLQKTLVKVQSALALSQGIEQLGDLGQAFKNMKAVAIDAFKGIKAAIGSTGIGLLVVALGTIVAYWDDIKAAVNGVSAEQKKLNAESEKNLKTQQEKLNAIGAQDNILKLQGKSEKDILQLKIKQTDETIKAAEVNLKNSIETTKAQIAAEARNKEILQGLLQFISLPITAILKTIDAVGSALGKNFNLTKDFFGSIANFVFDPEKVKKDGEDAVKEQEKALMELKNQRAGFELAIKDIDKKAADEARAKREKEAKEAEEKRKKDEEERIRKEEQLKREIKAAEDASEAEVKAFAEKERLIQEEKNKQLELEEKQYQDRLQKNADRLLKEAENEQLGFDQRLDKIKERKLLENQIEFDSLQDKLDFTAENESAITEIKRLEDETRVANAQFAADQLSAIAQIVGQDTAAGKALSIAAATISTYLSAQKAYESQFKPLAIVDSPVRGAIAAGVAVATGIANIRKIMAVQVPARGGGGAGGGAGISTSAPVAPQLAPQVMATQVNTAAVNQMGNRAARAYVLNADIQNEQQRNAYIDRNASIGNP